MANYNPKTEQLSPFQVKGDKPLSGKPLTIRVFQEDYDAFMKIPSKLRSKLLRESVSKIVQSFEEQKVSA